MAKDIAFILYNTPDYSEKVQVVVKDETLWMTQKAMSELFGVQVPAISKHLKNIFESGELREAYPSYFLDTKEFLLALDAFNASCAVYR